MVEMGRLERLMDVTDDLDTDSDSAAGASYLMIIVVRVVSGII